MNFTVEELELLIEALARAASRLESYARNRPAGRAGHANDEKAAAMRKLRTRLLRVMADTKVIA